MRKIDSVIIHCSDSRWGCREAIDRWHKERGWDGIGYHYVINNPYALCVDSTPAIDRDGLIEVGRGIEEVGAHCKGRNDNSIGICLIGKDMFTGKQFDSLRQLLNDIETKLEYSFRVYAHHELDKKKTCPNIEPGWLRAFLLRS